MLYDPNLLLIKRIVFLTERARFEYGVLYKNIARKGSDRGVTAKDNRRFVEAVLWIMRTGSPWRDLPAELGHWHRTFVRFARWREKGVWERIATALSGDADLEQLFIDSTIVRAHQHSAGAQKKQASRKSAARAAD